MSGIKVTHILNKLGFSIDNNAKLRMPKFAMCGENEQMKGIYVTKTK